VYKGLRDGVHEVAIKVFEHVSPQSASREMLLKEIHLLRSCRNSHIVQVRTTTLVVIDEVCKIWLMVEMVMIT
jgi:hypothetical protein